ncbi:hypothetical protein BS50DRAFT_592936 [Corynespora cassiicola Philippines]|uniref:Uncharacterized protein n=1 Tax=Corynespora cassiicola Philippines TaxID=1448308 RepID=A0A2T2N7S5_CORCC|nr:hypothetical protein BS50DRAFT_592936 [Corynespora cassiicola Philippines]
MNLLNLAKGLLGLGKSKRHPKKPPTPLPSSEDLISDKQFYIRKSISSENILYNPIYTPPFNPAPTPTHTPAPVATQTPPRTSHSTFSLSSASTRIFSRSFSFARNEAERHDHDGYEYDDDEEERPRTPLMTDRLLDIRYLERTKRRPEVHGWDLPLGEIIGPDRGVSRTPGGRHVELVSVPAGEGGRDLLA